MIANSFLDIYTVIFSWQVYGTLWDTLNGTGLAYIPFIIAIIGSLKQAYDQSAERVVASMEWSLLSMIIVLMLVVIPYQNNAVTIKDVEYTITSTSCNKADVSGTGDNTGKSADAVFADLAGAGTSVRLPVAWALVDYLSSSITYTAIKSMGCAMSFDEVMYELANVTIDDPALLERLDEFNQLCYRPAMADLQKNGIPAATVRSNLNAWEDPSYIGSSVLLNTAGRYYQNDQAYVNHAERYGYVYSPTPGSLDAGHEQAKFGATVTCKELWEGRPNEANGLEQDLLDSIKSTSEGQDAWNNWDTYGSDLYGVLTPAEEEQSYLKAVLDANAGNYKSVDNISVTAGSGETDWTDPNTYLDGVTNLITGGIAAWDGASTVAQMMVIKNALKTAIPMLIAMAQALVVIIAPLAMVWGGFRLNNFVLLAMTYFGLEFLNAILQMGYYFENKIALMSNQALFDGEVFASLTVYLVSFLQLFILPGIWLALMASTGASAMRGMASINASSSGTYGSAGSAGASKLAGRKILGMKK